MTIRPARNDDIQRLAALVAGAREMRARAGSISGLMTASMTQIEQTICDEVGVTGAGFGWLVAEGSDGVVAAARFGLIPAPPIYYLGGQFAGLLLDYFEHPQAPPDSFGALVVAIEEDVQRRGAAILLAAAPENDAKLSAVLNSHGYLGVTYFMTKGSLVSCDARGVRPATSDDVPAIVRLNGEARARLREASTLMWQSHSDAAARFGAWMSFSLTLKDRAMLVAPEDGEPTAFIIAQPASPLQVPLMFDRERIGVIDDFHCGAFGSSLTVPRDGRVGDDLLAAAETEFVRQKKDAAVAICPIAWTAKQSFLRERGYAAMTTWFVKAA